MMEPRAIPAVIRIRPAPRTKFDTIAMVSSDLDQSERPNLLITITGLRTNQNLLPAKLRLLPALW